MSQTPKRSTILYERSVNYARAMIESGRDRYNTPSPLFASQLDRATMSLPANRFASLDNAGVRDSDRAWFGGNVMHDQQLFELLYELSSLTGEATYAREADRALTWFFKNTQSPVTFLYPWGEHLSWDLIQENTVRQTQNDQIHEFFEYFDFWSVCRRISPTRCSSYALGLWRHQIADQATGEFSRHARYDIHGTARGSEFPRHGGFFVRTWAETLGHVSDGAVSDELGLAVTTLRDSFSARRSAIGLIPMGTRESRGVSETSITSQSLSQALDFERAADAAGGSLGQSLRDYAAMGDHAILSLPHLSRSRPNGFVEYANVNTGQPSDPRVETIESLGNSGTLLIYPQAALQGPQNWVPSGASPDLAGSVNDPLMSPDDSANFIAADRDGLQQEFEIGAIAFNGNEPAKVTLLVRGKREVRGFYRPYLRIGAATYYAPADQKLFDTWDTTLFQWATNPATNAGWKSEDFNDPAAPISFGIEARQIGSEGIAQITQMLVGIQLDSVAYTRMWDAGYGSTSTAAMAEMMAQRYDQTGNAEYRDLAIRGAELYLESSAPGSSTLLPKLHADIIKMMLHIWRLTGDQRYLSGADLYAKEAESLFLDASSPLPKVTSGASWYETITGGDDLMLQFFYLSRALQADGQ